MKEFSHITRKLIPVEQLSLIREKHKDKKIGYMCGCFDIFHVGHSIYFGQGKQYCDILVVGVGRDSVLKALKGESRSINTELNRALLVAAHQDVDYCVLQEDLNSIEKIEEYMKTKIDFQSIIKLLKSDVFITNPSAAGEDTKRIMCEELGISFKIVQRITPDFIIPTSSSEIIRKIKES